MQSSRSAAAPSTEVLPTSGRRSSSAKAYLNAANHANPGNLLRKLPLSFEANQGQAAESVKFLARGKGYTLFLTGEEAVLNLRSQSASRRTGARSQNGNGETGNLKLEIGNSKSDARHSSLVTRHSDSVLRMKLQGAREVRAEGLDPLPSKSNYFLGNDPTKWRTSVPNFGRVKYRDVYPGIDLVYYGKESVRQLADRSQESGGRNGLVPGDRAELEFDFVVAPGADPRLIRFALTPSPSPQGRGWPGGPGEGAPVRIAPNGDLVVSSGEGTEARLHKPVVYQIVDGKRCEIDGRYVLRAAEAETGNWKLDTGKSKIENPKSKIENPKYEVAFELASYDPALPLVIDPVLSYSTYVGGSGTDQGFGFDADAAGNAYVVGFTDSANFPMMNPIQGTYGGGIADCFITKINSAGTAVDFSTYLGGSLRDFCRAVSADSSGNIYVTGDTSSTNFPVMNGFQTTLKGTEDSFVTKLSPDGSAILYSTYLGSSAAEDGVSIVADDSGLVYTTGATQFSDFPVTAGAFQSTFGGGSTDAYFSVLDTNLSGASSLIYSTFLGAGGAEFPLGIAVDAGGKAYVFGDTRSTTGFPVTVGAFQTTFAGGISDAFVAKFDPTQSGAASLVYCTLLGGSGTEAQSEIPRSIAVGPSGLAYVVSDTTSTNFPVTAGAFQSANAGGSSDAFLTVLNSTGTALVYSTYLGGTGQDIASGVIVDSGSNAYVVGFAGAADFPIKNASQATYGQSGDAFVAQFNPFQSGAASLNFSSFLGGSGSDQAFNVDLDAAGNVYISGTTLSTDFPTLNPIQASSAGGQDSFVAKLTPTLFGAIPYLSQADSPFYADIQAGNMYLETFEDGLLNTPGVTASAGAPFGPGGLTDSVDSDDGAIDGSGTNGHSFFSGDGPGGITFTFNATTLGGFPTQAGIAWTDGGGTTTFEAFDNVGASLGVVGPVAIADGSNNGGTGEDRFFGAVNPSGISAIHISNSSGGIEVDHLQYGPYAGAGGLTLSPASLNFGGQHVATTSSPMQVTLTNTGAATLTFASVNTQVAVGNTTPSPDFASGWDSSSVCFTSNTLSAGQSCVRNVTFTPISTGAKTAVIAFNSDAASSPNYVNLTGTGTANPAITLGPAVNFTGNPLNLTCPTKAVTLTNTGDLPLDIASIAASAPFSVASHTCPATLGVSASCIIQVKFAPVGLGPAAGTLTVTTSPATTGNTVALTGNGTPACALLARVRSVTVLRGTDAQDFAIEDAKPSCSPVNLNLACSVDNPAACLLNPAVIAPSGASTLKVSNLRRVAAEALQVTVTSTSEFRQATELVSVRFADFAMTKSPEAATVEAGGVATYALAIRPVNGLAGNLALACSGAPRGARCAVEPSSATLDGTSLAQVKVKVTTTSAAGALPTVNGPSDWARRTLPLLLVALLTLMLGALVEKSRRVKESAAADATRAVAPVSDRRVRAKLVLAAAMLLMLLWASCGGGGGSMNFGAGATPAGNYTLTVTGTYSSASGPTPGTLANSTTVALRVN